MENMEQKVSRKKIAGWMGVLALFTIIGAAINPFKNKTPKKVKMLTRDGKLVEVDELILTNNRKKITNKELQDWVKVQ